MVVTGILGSQLQLRSELGSIDNSAGRRRFVPKKKRWWQSWHNDKSLRDLHKSADGHHFFEAKSPLFSDENYSTPKKLSGVALHCLDVVSISWPTGNIGITQNESYGFSTAKYQPATDHPHDCYSPSGYDSKKNPSSLDPPQFAISDVNPAFSQKGSISQTCKKRRVSQLGLHEWK